MKLMCEVIDKVGSLCEDVKNASGEVVGKDYFIEGPFVQMNIKNRNGRFYPENVVLREIKRFDEEFIANDRALGELDHPDDFTVNLKNVSHRILSLKHEGNDFVGKAKILDTPSGNIVKTFIKEGITLGVSTRGVGSLERRGEKEIVKDDYKFSTVDIVSDPSGPSAFVRGILESKEWKVVKDPRAGNILVEMVLDKYEGLIEKKSSRVHVLAEAEILKQWNTFLKDISNVR